jgi:two-component system, chemotaxis family, protein-glutamate methylesterase/glutaminase
MAYELVVIGSSWGGLDALERLLAALPASFPAPVVIAQHRGPASGEGMFASLLRHNSGLPVADAEDKDRLEAGRVYVAPPDYHLLVERGSLALSVEAPVAFSRPSIDVLFESAADAYADRLVAVVLTGANEDGAEGLLRVKERGGFVIVQDPATAEQPAMPEAAVATGAADRVLPLEGIGPCLTDLCRGDVRSAV